MKEIDRVLESREQLGLPFRALPEGAIINSLYIENDGDYILDLELHVDHFNAFKIPGTNITASCLIGDYRRERNAGFENSSYLEKRDKLLQGLESCMHNEGVPLSFVCFEHPEEIIEIDYDPRYFALVEPPEKEVKGADDVIIAIIGATPFSERFGACPRVRLRWDGSTIKVATTNNYSSSL